MLRVSSDTYSSPKFRVPVTSGSGIPDPRLIGTAAGRAHPVPDLLNFVAKLLPPFLKPAAVGALFHPVLHTGHDALVHPATTIGIFLDSKTDLFTLQLPD